MRNEKIRKIIQKNRKAYKRILKNGSEDIKEEYRRSNTVAKWLIKSQKRKIKGE